MAFHQHSPSDNGFDSFSVPAWSPMPPAPVFAAEPTRPLVSAPRITFGILLALASGFVGCGWGAFTLLWLALSADTGVGVDSFGVTWVLGGLVVALSGTGGIGTAVTARRPVGGLWVCIWIWMSCVFGGLMAAMVVAFMVWFNVANR